MRYFQDLSKYMFFVHYPTNNRSDNRLCGTCHSLCSVPILRRMKTLPAGERRPGGLRPLRRNAPVCFRIVTVCFPFVLSSRREAWYHGSMR